MTDRTRDELVHEAMDILGLLASGQDPAPEDLAAVDKRVPDLLAHLNEIGAAYIPDPERIPLGLFLDVAALLAFASYSSIGAGQTPPPGSVEIHEANLLAKTAAKPTYQLLATTYF